MKISFAFLKRDTFWRIFWFMKSRISMERVWGSSSVMDTDEMLLRVSHRYA